MPLTPGTPQSIDITDDGTPTGTVIGTVEIDADGTVTLVPAPDYYGPIGFDYEIEDADGDTDTARVDIDVTPVNDAPRTQGTIPDQAGQDAQTGISVATAGTFFDVEGDTLTYSADNLPRGLSIDPGTGVISGDIHPSASQGGNNGVHRVIVTATDPGGASTVQEFTWTVMNPAPVASDDFATTAEDTPVTGNVLTGAGPGDTADTDPDGDPLSLEQFTVDGATYAAGETAMITGVGTLRMEADGEYEFVPAPDWNGAVPTVTYTVSDGEGGTSTAELSISVTPVNDAPVIAGGPQAGTVIEAGHEDDGTVRPGTPSVSGTFTATDVDNDPSELAWSIVGTPDTTYGEFILDPATGAWSYTLDNTLDATQELNEDDTVPLSFTVQVSDGSGGTAQQTVAITIEGSNDAPVATADTGSVKESGVQDGGNTAETGATTASGNVLTNDSDVDDGETASLQVGSVRFGATTGSLDGTPLPGTYGSLVIDADGNYTYTLDNDRPATQALAQDDSDTEVFSYTVIDVNGAAATSTLTITVQGTNDRPEIISAASDAQGSVTEAGTADPVGTPEVRGTLTATDVDTDPELQWSIAGAGADGAYGTISIDPDNGEWIYTLDNTREATQALNDGDVETETFTARVTDEHGAWQEQTITITVNGANDSLTGVSNATVTLTEDPTEGPAGNARAGSLQEYVSDVDDTIVLVSFGVAGDPDTYAPGDTATIPGVGTISIALDGGYVFTPLPDYSGEVPVITYTMAEVDGGQSITQTLTFEITPVADAPLMEEDSNVSTDEDASVDLDLVLPTVADGTDHNGTGKGDDPERLGAITLTPGGNGAAGASFSTTVNGILTTLVPVGGVITIVITDTAGSDVASDLHVTDPDLVPPKNEAGGVYYLTEAEYEAIRAEPGAESHHNFTVTVSATSYEVDATGKQRLVDSDSGPAIPVPGATATQVVTVDVLAVTDTPGLTLEQPADPTETGAISLTTTPAAGADNARITAAINEDTPLVLTDVLRETFQDTDGSERYWYEITGLPPGTVVEINGVEYTANASGTAAMPESAAFTAGAASNPAFTITPPSNYSSANDTPITATITLNARDSDGDSSLADPEVESVSVDLELQVHAVPDNVTLPAPAATAEDTPITFLARLVLVDTDGSEAISQVRITDLPTTGGAWALLDHDGNAVPIPPGGNASGGGLVLAIGTGPGEYTLEQIKDFTLLPPAHSSLDGSITVYVSTTEAGANTASGDPLTANWTHTLPIAVHPAAERTDSDSGGAVGNDVTMNADHSYEGFAGAEDEWYALGTDATDATGGDGFPLGASWTNEDSGEFTYAVLTPTLASDTPATPSWAPSSATTTAATGPKWSSTASRSGCRRRT